MKFIFFEDNDLVVSYKLKVKKKSYLKGLSITIQFNFKKNENNKHLIKFLKHLLGLKKNSIEYGPFYIGRRYKPEIEYNFAIPSFLVYFDPDILYKIKRENKCKVSIDEVCNFLWNLEELVHLLREKVKDYLKKNYEPEIEFFTN